MRLGRSGKIPKAPRAWLHGAGDAPRKRGTSTGGSGTEPAVASYPGAETLDKDNQKAIESIAYLLKTRQGSRICGRTLEETTFGRTEYDNWSCPRDLEVLLRGATLGQNGAEYLGHNMITAWRAML